MATYLLLASACPAIPVPTTALQNRTSETPLVLSKLSLGDTTALFHKFNQNAVEAEIMGRYGAGVYAVQTGLGLSIGTGLNVVVAAGQAIIDAPRTLSTPTNVLVSDAITNGCIWMTQAGTLTATTNTTPPAGNVAFLGFYTSAAGAISSVDESGVLRLDQGSLPLRITADTGCPTDSPTAGVKFLNRCLGGLFLFDSISYHNLTNAGRSALTFSSDANKTLTVPEYSNYMVDFTNAGTTLTATRDVIVPLSPAGRPWFFRNNSPGAQSIRVIGASGTGQTIATGATATVMSDGTNIIAA